ncbi:MAG TPA: glucokinase [Mesorhizobium sp.]|nr:glucokinase [Mesorhizobium sp.]
MPILASQTSCPRKPRAASLAVAAPICGGAIALTNSHWSFRPSELCQSLEFEAVRVLNDFEALALSLPTLGPADVHKIGGLAPEQYATKIVLGPGTGLGVAGLVWSGERWVAVAGEGGHMSFGAPEELTLLQGLADAGGHLSAEQAISGPGLAAIYRAMVKSKNRTLSEPIDVVASALAGDAVAGHALGLFTAWLGRFAGNIALAFGARGGVYIGGGIAPKITAALSAGSFRAAFEQKGRMSDYLAPIPIYVILAEFATLKGAASALRGSLTTPIPNA